VGKIRNIGYLKDTYIGLGFCTVALGRKINKIKEKFEDNGVFDLSIT
jgi:hypothetical protein